MGIKVSVACIVKNNIKILNSFSAIEELVASLDSYQPSHKVRKNHPSATEFNENQLSREETV